MKILKLISLFVISFVFISCEKIDEILEPGVPFHLDPQLNKVFIFKTWQLDSLNSKIGEGSIFYEKCISKNVSIGGVNDAFASLKYLNQTNYVVLDTTYLRVVNGKDVYEWIDTTQIFSATQNAQKFALQKIMSSYAWVGRALLSKGDKAEYVLLPDKYFIPDTTNPNVVVKISFKGKNEGFEDVTVPAGTFKAYKVTNTMEVTLLFNNNPMEKVNINTHIWVSDDLDWWIKQLQPTVRVNFANGYFTGFIAELIQTQ